MKHFLRCFLAAFSLMAAGFAFGADYVTSRVISVNKSGGNAADSAADSNGLVAVPANAWNNYPALGAKTGGVTWNGTSAVTLENNWTVNLSGNTSYYWIPDGIENILRCYIDDNANNHAKMIFANLPFAYYDVYVYMAADGAAQFSPVSTIIDGVTTSYTCEDDGVGVVGTAGWGQSQQLKSKAGKNVIIIKNQSAANITIDGGTRGATRGAIAAVQLVEVESPYKIWGTAGREGEGVSTKNDGAFQNSSWSFNFSKNEGIVHDDIDLTKRVTITKIRMMQRATKASKPTTATLTQGANTMTATSVTSHDDDATGMTLYNSTGVASVIRGYHEFIFDGSVDFDPTANITLSFGGNVGCSVTQPANSVMVSGGWSPVIEFTGTYPSDVANYTATIDADTTFTGITSWEPSRPTTFAATDVLQIGNTSSAKLTMNENLAIKMLKIVNAEGAALTLDMQTMPTIGTYDFTRAAGGVVLDASGVDGRELAKNAVAGAPYSHWLLKGAVKGQENITIKSPSIPSGYEATTVTDDFGVRIVVTAPRAARFGSVNINFMGNQSKATSDDNSKVGTLTTEVGGHPVVGTGWNDLEGKNQTDTAVAKYVQSDGTITTSGNITVTASQVANAYGSGSAKNMLLTGYIDDSQSPIVQIHNIPFSKYRVILYRATDTANTTFSAAQIGTTSSNTKIYYGPAKGNTDTRYTVFGTTEVNWGKSDKRDGYYEGVNYIVSDVLEGTAGSATAYIYSHKHAGRACVAAIQIVEVGKIIEGTSEYKATISTPGTHNLSELTWSPDPFAPTAETDVKITIDSAVTGEVIINLDRDNMDVQSFVLASSGNATMTLAGNHPRTVSSWDFSGTKGRVAFGFTGFDESKVVKGTYPRLGLAYPYTGTIQSGYDYIGEGNVLTLTTIDNDGSVLIGGSGTLHGDLDVGRNSDNTTVIVGGRYTSPDNDVSFSVARGSLTIAEGADISIPCIALNKSGQYGGGAGHFTVNGKLTVTSECGSNVAAETGNYKGVVLQYGWLSPRGLHTRVNKTGSLIAEQSWIQCSNNAYNYITFTINGGIVKARGINVGPASSHGAANNPSITVTNGGTLQLAEGLIQQNNATYSFNTGVLAGYSYSGSTGYSWTPNTTTINGSMTFDPNGVNITTTANLTGNGAKVVVTNSAASGVLTLNHANGYTGGTVVKSDATLRLGNNDALNTGNVTVEKGGTLDYFGHGPTNNLVTVAGTGVNGVGALINTGADISFVLKIALSDDATLGGSSAIALQQGSYLDLGGHSLTLNGEGMTLKLGGFTVQNGEAVVVERGTLASNGATSLGNADLSVAKNGILDLAGGNHLSCSNFVCVGTVRGKTDGGGAELQVHGLFNALEDVTIPRLKLFKTSTLQGQGLKITGTFETEDGDLTILVAEPLTPSIVLAKVPESKEAVTIKCRAIVNGSTDYVMRHSGAQILLISGGVVYADVTLTSILGGTDFTELWVDGVVRDFYGKAGVGSGKTNLNITVTYADGTTTTHTYDYSANFSHVISGLDARQRYIVQAYLTIEKATVDAYSAKEDAATAKTLANWIDEDWETFGKQRMGTGDWDYSKDSWGTAIAEDKRIIFENATTNQCVRFVSTNRTSLVRTGTLKDVRIQAAFTRAAYCLGETGPKLPCADDLGLVAVTLATNALGECQFAVAASNAWQAVARDVFAPSFGKTYEVVAWIDEEAETIDYGVVNGEIIAWLYKGAKGSYASGADKADFVQVVFAGSGTIAKISGACHDANLCRRYGFVDEGYANVAAAREVLGEDDVIEPIWWSTYRLSDDAGSFSYCTNGLLTILKDKWYHDIVEPGDPNKPGSVRYHYHVGNNWIEYADAGGVVSNGNGGYRVTSEEGLAWIAEQATNAWFSGDITLVRNLDLSSKNWTPIAHFTGTFDGKGFAIAGLNNTNAIDDVALGEAGRYPGGTTNAWGYSAYGLFGCTTNASFRGVTLSDVAISNVADSVAALVGVHARGDLEVTQVTVGSGYVRGAGRAVAGLLTVGGKGGEIGDVVVTNNVNYATIAGSVENSADGGNVAQILAGTTWGTTFGTVVATNNVGEGVFDVDMSSDYDWLDLPVCNFAPAVIRTDENDDFWSFVEANDPLAIPIDPVHRAARMSMGRFANGDRNILGGWTDQITAVPANTELVITNLGTAVELDGWSTVYVDRDVTLDLDGNSIYCVYDGDVFDISENAFLTIKDGKITVGTDSAAFNDESRVDNQGCTVVKISANFEERTIERVAEAKLEEGKMKLVVPLTSSSCRYGIEMKSSLTDSKWEVVDEQSGNGGDLVLEAPAETESGFYRVYTLMDE